MNQENDFFKDGEGEEKVSRLRLIHDLRKHIIGRPFTMQDSLDEMRAEVERLLKMHKRDEIRLRLCELETQGFQPQFDYRREKDVCRLEIELMRLDERKQKVRLVQGALQLMQLEPFPSAIVNEFEKKLLEKEKSNAGCQ